LTQLLRRELRVATKASRRITLLAQLPVTEFLAATAAGTAVPGGGSVAALSAAMAASLVEMVANLTIGKKGFDAVAEVMREIAESAGKYREKLMQDMDRDANAYTRVLEAFRLPRATEEERETRNAAVQAAFREAATVPLAVAMDAQAVLELAGTVVEKGNPNAVTDGLVGAMMARTAVLSALYNVSINLDSIRDEDFVKDLRSKGEALQAEVMQRERTILASLDV
jgi:methenyltetrahydrofolate cyclohydrolase